jgi:hypothetical protein
LLFDLQTSDHIFRIDTRERFYENLNKFMTEARKTPLESDVLFSPDRSSVIASRFFVQSTRVENAIQEVKMLHSVRKVAANAPFKVVVYHPFFGFFDQYAEVVETTIDCTVREVAK